MQADAERMKPTGFSNIPLSMPGPWSPAGALCLKLQQFVKRVPTAGQPIAGQAHPTSMRPPHLKYIATQPRATRIRAKSCTQTVTDRCRRRRDVRLRWQRRAAAGQGVNTQHGKCNAMQWRLAVAACLPACLP
jgi:hypothetical protein